MSRKKIFVSFADRKPDLVAEWHPTKNGDKTPYNTSYGSAKKIWWRCLVNPKHEWESTPNKRSAADPRGCPECANAKRAMTKRKNIVAKRGSLAINNPALAQEWHPTKNGDLTPYNVTVNTPIFVWWQCSKDKRHEWEAAINSRNGGSGCPICSGHKLLVGFNDLASLNPKLAAQWHPTKNGSLKPNEVKIHDDINVWWQCPKGHEWEAKIKNRASGEYCPVCLGRICVEGYNDLATIIPRLAMEWHPTKNNLTPRQVVVHSNKKVWWLCENGHEWMDTVSHRSSGRRCPKCFGEFKTSFPEQAIYFYLRKVTETHNRYLIEKRTEIDVYLPNYKLGIEYDGAYYHKGYKALEREKRKQDKLKSLGITLIRVKESQGEASENVIFAKPGASDYELTDILKSLLALVNKNAKVTFNIDIDVERDRNSIYEQYIRSVKERSLAVVNPELAKEWHPTKNGNLLPTYFLAGSNKTVWWRCKYEHEWKATISSRNKGAGCKECYRLRRKKQL